MKTFPAPRPQLAPEELQQVKWLLGGGLTLLSVATVFYLDIPAWTLTGLAVGGVVTALVRPDWPGLIPRRAHRLAFPFIVAFFLGDLWLTGEVLPAMVRLDILLLAYRGITYRQKRDDLQVIVLGLFLVVVAGVLTVSLTFAVQIVAFTACALAFLLAITLAEAGEQGGRVVPGDARELAGFAPSGGGRRSVAAAAAGPALTEQRLPEQPGRASTTGLPAPVAEAADAGDAGDGDTPRRFAPPLSGRDANAVPPWARQVDWRRLLGRVRAVTDWRVVALGGALFAGLVALSALLFLAIPRFQLENSLLLERFITKKARTGFSDTIRFGEISDIQQDNSVALSVDVSDRSRIPASPYWRMVVLDEYQDGTFRLSPALRRDALAREQGGRRLRGAVRRREAAPVYWTFYLESGVSRFLPLLGAFDTIQFREPQNVRFGRELGVVALRDDPVTMTAYRVEGMETGARIADAGFGARLDEEQSNPRRAGALMLRLGVGGADRAVLTKIVAEIEHGGARAESREEVKRGRGASEEMQREPVKRGGDERGGMKRNAGEVGGKRGGGAASPPVAVSMSAEEFARRADAWLAQRHAYSLSPKIPAGEGDPLVRWLASREGGHCELFAGSLVLLARAAGLPARVVTGFRGGSWNGYSNNFTLRNSDAHAWCEVFDRASDAWLRADPTPGGAASTADNQGEAALARVTDRSWTARFDSLRVFWYRRIVNFDQQSQLETLKAVKAATQDSGRRLRAALERLASGLRAWAAAPWLGGRAAWVAAVAVAVAGLAWVGWAFRFSIFEFRMGGKRGRGDAVRIEAGRWLGQLRGWRRGAEALAGGATASGAEARGAEAQGVAAGGTNARAAGADGAAAGGMEARGADARVTEVRAAEAGDGAEAAGVVRELQRLRFGARETWGDAPAIFRRARRVWRESKRRRAESPDR